MIISILKLIIGNRHIINIFKPELRRLKNYNMHAALPICATTLYCLICKYMHNICNYRSKQYLLKIIYPIAIITACILLPLTLEGKGLQITSYVDKTTVGVNDELKLTVEISGDNVPSSDDFKLPEIRNFNILGSSSSSSSSFSVASGRISSSVTRSYTYILKAVNQGRYIIPPISIQFEGETYTTDPINITVVEGTTTPPPPVSQRFREDEHNNDSLSDNIFIIADVPKTTVFRGEPLIVHYKIYSRYDVANLSFVSEPNFVGFWKDDIFFASRMNFRRETYKGRMFNSMLLRTIVLYPTTTGTLTIPSFNISADIVVRARSFWDFNSTRKLNLQSDPIDIVVNEVPAISRPEGFTGAVGSFSITSEINTNKINLGDPLTLSIEISGTGNIKHFNPPIISDLPYLRVLDPDINTEFEVVGDEIKGLKIIRYPMIALQDGNFNIPPIVFSYFDPDQENFNTLKTDSYAISIQPIESTVPLRGHTPQDIHIDGSDIYYIYRETDLTGINPIYRHIGYWLLWIVAIITIPIANLYSIEKHRMTQDKSLFRQKIARKIFSKYLQMATNGAKKGDVSFYANASNGLCNYLTDILKIPRGSTIGVILHTMKNKRYSHDCIDKVKCILYKCVEARFKPGSFDEKRINSDYQELISAVNEISGNRISVNRFDHRMNRLLTLVSLNSIKEKIKYKIK